MSHTQIARNLRRTLPLLLMSFTLLTGCALLPSEQEALAPPLVEPIKPTYQTTVVKEGPIETGLQGTAQFESANVVFYQFLQSGGRVSEVFVKTGDEVKAGDVLVQLEFDNLDMELLNRQFAMLEAEGVLYAALQAEQTREIDKAKIKVQIAKHQLDETQRKLNQKQLRAEAPGRVTFVDNIKPGDLIESHRPLVGISDPDDIRLVYESVSTSTISNIKVGTPVTIEYKRNSYTGHVLQSPHSSPQEGDSAKQAKYSRMLYISFENLSAEGGESPKIGDMANITIVTERRENALLLPRTALKSYQNNQYVQVLEDGFPRQIDVEVGITTSNTVEIVGGLHAGQEVILGR